MITVHSKTLGDPSTVELPRDDNEKERFTRDDKDRDTLPWARDDMEWVGDNSKFKTENS